MNLKQAKKKFPKAYIMGRADGRAWADRMGLGDVSAVVWGGTTHRAKEGVMTLIDKHGYLALNTLWGCSEAQRGDAQEVYEESWLASVKEWHARYTKENNIKWESV